ncbi:hypothetical protein HanXRQr2_Chr15g0691721 [Helianthus annuus]|uniref:Uncharacterized protein n=1 Tax=Helianthus annuus TaxID=4232 RepID=A0A251S8A1_HELAN|nr:hypothetical protein HanXRQr2_Chr15g0691721 [Helianthus annuus]KAJ0831138.1 hypothetical protein HanPSC8_Chr15g0663561 [Helianthus annuus]
MKFPFRCINKSSIKPLPRLRVLRILYKRNLLIDSLTPSQHHNTSHSLCFLLTNSPDSRNVAGAYGVAGDRRGRSENRPETHKLRSDNRFARTLGFSNLTRSFLQESAKQSMLTIQESRNKLGWH